MAEFGRWRAPAPSQYINARLAILVSIKEYSYPNTLFFIFITYTFNSSTSLYYP
jgi:hypothetical protein